MDSGKTQNKPLTIITHIIFWALIFTLPILVRSTYGNSHEGDLQLVSVIIYSLLIVSLFYLNAYSLIPYVLRRKRTVSYVLISICFLVLFFICNKLAAF